MSKETIEEVVLNKVTLKDLARFLEAWILGKEVYISKKRLWPEKP